MVPYSLFADEEDKYLNCADNLRISKIYVMKNNAFNAMALDERILKLLANIQLAIRAMQALPLVKRYMILKQVA